MIHRQAILINGAKNVAPKLRYAEYLFARFDIKGDYSTIARDIRTLEMLGLITTSKIGNRKVISNITKQALTEAQALLKK